jgi:putative phage-type endonuclease
MKYFDKVIQGSDEWLELRSGVFTASEIGVWVSKDKRTKTDDKAALTLICKKLAEMSGCEMEPFFDNWAMRRGTELEPEARSAYTDETGIEVEEVGFCLHDNGGFGCSPDGFIENREGMLEIKCPLPQTHVRYLLDGELPEAYKCQVHMQMAVTGAEHTHFYSYCPSLPSMRVDVPRDDFTESMLSGLLRLTYEFDAYKAVMKTKWDEMKSRYELKNQNQVT